MVEVGQKLWWVGSPLCGYPNQAEVTVVKVGRKWADLNNRQRIDIATMRADGNGRSSPGTCYTSQKEYEDRQKLMEEWERLRKWMANRYSIPPAMTVEKIKSVWDTLGVSSTQESTHA